MKAAERLGIRTRSRAFVEARIRRLILDTLDKYGQLSVLSDHAVELNREESEQARSADDFLQTNSALIDTSSPPDLSSYMHHQSPPASLFARCPQKTPRAFSPPEAKWVQFNCATTKPHFGPGFGYVPPLGLIRGLGCLLCSYSHREAPHSPSPPSGLTRCQTVPLF